MGFITTGRTSRPRAILELRDKIFDGVKSQKEVDALLPAFRDALDKDNISMTPIPPKTDARVVFDKKLGVVITGWMFRFPDA